MKIIAHEKLVLQLVKSFVEKHNIDCDFDYCRTFDVVMSEEFLQYVTGSFEAYKTAGGDISDIVWLDADAAKKVNFYNFYLPCITETILSFRRHECHQLLERTNGRQAAYTPRNCATRS
jgi:hypothetical protein